MYAGRADLSKNIPLLLGYLREYWARRGTPLTLIRTGRDPIELPPALGAIVLDLGDVSVQERQDAYAAADLFVHPSVHESFSIVLMEAWLKGGVSAQVTALEIERPDHQTKKMIVRRHGDVDLKRNPHIAADEFKLLQITQSAGLATPAPYYLDQSGEIFPIPYVVIEYIEG